MTRRPNKHDCPHTENTHLGQVISRSGTSMFANYCDRCGGRVGKWIPHTRVEQTTQTAIAQAITDTPVEKRREAHPCERCAHPYSEHHHWAPRHLFGEQEAAQWPTSWLCTDCHLRWHTLTGTT